MFPTKARNNPIPAAFPDWMRQFMDRPRWLRESLSDEAFFDEDWMPAVDVKEDEKAYMVKADIPGVSPEDVEVTMERGVLTIRGERKSERKEERDNYHRIERFSGSFSRRFTLPDAADSDGVEADMKDGVLQVRIPKQEKAVSRRINIKH
jgi:HSP20 family protein